MMRPQFRSTIHRVPASHVNTLEIGPDDRVPQSALGLLLKYVRIMRHYDSHNGSTSSLPV